MLPRGQLGNHAAVFGMSIELGGDDGGEQAYAAFHNCGSRLIARTLNAENLHS
jgi:hypothetical protein